MRRRERIGGGRKSLYVKISSFIHITAHILQHRNMADVGVRRPASPLATEIVQRASESEMEGLPS